MAYHKLGEWQRIALNVGDYWKKREEVLKRIALSAAQKVKFSGSEYELPAMNSSERRIIHLFFAEDPEITTESRGEKNERRVVLKPKNVTKAS